ncbi:MAG: replicative DNA helicase [Candidatus Bipolaricaulia bacterium]
MAKASPGKAQRQVARALPKNREAEEVILGAAMLDDQEVVPLLLERLSPEHFYWEAHQKIYRTILELFDRGEPADYVIVANRLEEKDWLAEVGGSVYLSRLMDGVTTTANVEYYAEIVRKKAILRALVRSGREIAELGFEEEKDLPDILDHAERVIFEISGGGYGENFYLIRDFLHEHITNLEELHRDPDKHTITGLSTGFKRFDEMTSGFQPSDLIVIAGRPSMGKSSLGLSVARNAAIREGTSVGIFNLEMTKEQVLERLLCGEAKISLHRMRGGYVPTEHWRRIADAAGKLQNASIILDDTPTISIMEIKARARRMRAKHGLDLLIVDYIQLIEGALNVDNREQQIAHITRSLKGLARELRIPVIAMSQLSRAVEHRQSRKPRLSDLRECVTGDTLVVLADGRRVPIQNLVRKQPDVIAVTPGGCLTQAVSDKVWYVGQRQVFSVQLASGRRIRTTGKHRLLGAAGWVRVSELNVGDRLAIARYLPEPANTESWPDRRVALLGQLIGDGSYLSGQPMRYTTSSEENSKIVTETAREEFGATVKRYPGRGNWHQLLISGNGNRWYPAGINKWLRELGIFGQRSHEKRIPEVVFRLRDEQIGLLLRHLWATDGTIHARQDGQRGSHTVYYSTNSSGLATDVTALLLRLGIVARIQKVQKGVYRPTYMVQVMGAEAQLRFLERVGAFGPRRVQAEQLSEVLEGTMPNTNVDTLPIEYFDRVRVLMAEAGISHRQMAALRGTSYGGSSHFSFAPSRQTLLSYADLLDNDELKGQANSDLFWDRVVAIEPVGEEKVYDLTVPGPASWLADGIVSHNSGAIEQDSDVVAFIYREDYYEDAEASERRGPTSVAEILIQKQRNGPTGVFKLIFHRDYASFYDYGGDGQAPF